MKTSHLSRADLDRLAGDMSVWPPRLERSAPARHLVEQLDSALARVEHTPANLPPPEGAPFYRVVAWNVRRGLAYDGILKLLRHDPILAEADVLLLTETDKGMARSGNRDVARELAHALGMHAAFVPCYLNLTKGNAAERSVEGENTAGLHGNAILSRYPLSELRIHSLPNGKDKLAGPEKRVGRQRGLTARVALPGLPLTVTCLHLDAHASRAHRALQMEQVLEETTDLGGPRLIGGDWNTTTYDCQSARPAMVGLLGRLFEGLQRSIQDHHLRPERRHERPLFEGLRRHGFEWQPCNVAGIPTWHFDLAWSHEGLGDWLPSWTPRAVGWLLRETEGRASFKLDWFAARGLECARPAVLADLRQDGERVSDHDPLVLDLPRPRLS